MSALIGAIAYSWHRRRYVETEEERISRLIDAMEHIHTPLTKIQSPLHELMQRPQDKESAEMLQAIDHNVQRVIDLVSQFLNGHRKRKLQTTGPDNGLAASPDNERQNLSAIQPSRKQRILLVDDDGELCEYISSELSSRYKLRSCSNGMEALQLLLGNKETYDVVVSELQLPTMDGFALLRSIKSNSAIAHTPVVLLTSANDVGHRLEGLSYGADAILAKPLLMQELQATLDALIANCQRQRGKYEGHIDAAKQSAETVSSQTAVAPPQVDADQLFLEQLVKKVNDNISDTDFGIEQLSAELGMSRSQLHRRMKDLTGFGAGEFVRNMRLEQAARLLKGKNLNVSQVAYSVGFSNLGHFSKIFRQHFGVYPSEYLNEQDNKTE